MKFILASRSKRRTQILKACGIRHEVFVTNAKEVNHSRIHSARLVLENARRKAEAARGHFKKGVVLGVDTVVLFRDKNIGKPAGKAAARRMLKAYSGKKIVVYTGLHLIDIASNRSARAVDRTILRVREISDRDIDRYFLRLGPYDRAGGFSIEGPGAIIFDDLSGSYFNVLGLPMGRLAELFKKVGLDILDFMR